LNKIRIDERPGEKNLKTRTVNLEYGKAEWAFDVPEDAQVIDDIPPAQVRTPLADPVAALHQALNEPLGFETLDKLIDRNTKVAITVNDWMGGSFYAAPVVLDLLHKKGIKDQDIRIMIAGGTHAKVTRNQLYASNMGRWITGNKPPYPEAFRILPPEIIEKWCHPGSDRIERHDAADLNSMVNLGPTADGVLVEVNNILNDSDVVIHLGWGPLPLAPWGGFLGGGILGLTSARSILGHHSPDVVNHPKSTHGDATTQKYGHHKSGLMEKVEHHTRAKFFLIDPYFNGRGQFAGRWWAGKWQPLRDAEVAYAREEFTVKLPRSADIVIMDCPPWMFHGATSNPMLAMSHVTTVLRGYLPPNPLLRKGGVVICVTPCDGTIDDWYRPSDREAIALYHHVGRDINELFDRYSDDFLNRSEYIYKYQHCYGHHPLHAFWLLAAEQYAFDQSCKVIFAGASDSEPLRQMGIHAVPDLKTAWQTAIAASGKSKPDVTVLSHCPKRFGLTFDIAQG
jgi:hypothetical protein